MQPTQVGDQVASMPILTPEELAPHFPQLEIISCLGRGGMGVVYKARQKSLNRLVALKLLAPERAGDPQFAGWFEKEAHALAALNHPNIVGIYDFGHVGGFYFLLMEFVDGVNLRQLMQAKKLSPQEALSVVPPVCEALQCAHDHGIVHRDIKPENLMIDKAGGVKIADFGIAKIVHSLSTGPQDEQAVSQSEVATMPLGTPDYAAPEQHGSDVTTDHRADIYSLGVVLYEMLTGERPKEDIVPPSRRVRVDIRIDEIVLRALEAEPELRYQTAGEFRTQLVTMMSGPETATAAPIIASPPYRSSRTAIAGFAIFFAGLSGLLGALTFALWPTPPLPLVVSIPAAALLAISFGIFSRGNSLGTRAIIGGCFNLAIWLAIAGLIVTGHFHLSQGTARNGHLELLSPASFGPVTEREVTGALDLDTGTLTELPLPRLQAESGQARYEWIAHEESAGPWMSQRGADIIASENHGLTGLDLFAANLEPEDWQTMTPEALDRKLASLQVRKPGGLWSFSGSTFGFRTREGGTGILQVLEPAPSRGVKVRYKLASLIQHSGPPFVAQVRHGSVQLLGLAPHPSTGFQSWFADGFAASERFPSLGGSNTAAGKVTKEIAFRITTHTGSPSEPVLRFDQESGVTGMGSVWNWQDRKKTAMTYTQALACPPGAKAVNIKVGVADGEWQTALQFNKPAAQTPMAGVQTSEEDGIWEAGAEMNGGNGADTVLALHYSRREDFETRLVHVDGDGKAVPLQGNVQRTGGLNHSISSIPAADYSRIREFQLQKRKYEWVEFRGVSLQIDNRTTVGLVNSTEWQIAAAKMEGPARKIDDASAPSAKEAQGGTSNFGPQRNAASHAPQPAVPPKASHDEALQPKLRFLAWHDEWAAQSADKPGGAFHPDGSRAESAEDLHLLGLIRPGFYDFSGLPADKRPRFLHLWFSHPLLEDRCFREVTLYDAACHRLKPMAAEDSSARAADPLTDHLGWLFYTTSVGHGAELPPTITVRLKYSLGAWQAVHEFKPDDQGTIALGNGSQFSAIGQDLEDKAFLAISVDMNQDTERQFGAIAMAKDGRELQSFSEASGGGNGQAVHVQQFLFSVPLSDVALFRLMSRKIISAEFENVATHSRPAGTAN